MVHKPPAAPALARILDDLQARGQYVVTAEELTRRTGPSGVALEAATMRVSTPEATAFDLIRFAHTSGGLGNVATVLADLAERIQPKALASAARARAVPDVQRLGFVLDTIGQKPLATGLHAWLAKQRVRPVLLAPRERRGKRQADPRWKVIANTAVEVD